MRVMSRFLHVWVLAAMFAVLPGHALDDSITVTVNPEERQRFGGLGFNLASNTPIGWPSNTTSQKTFIQNMITQSRFRNIVLWGNLWMNPQDTTSADTSGIAINPMLLNITSWAQEAGVDFVMINPISDRPLAQHVRFWTQCVQMWRRRGVNVNAMTFLNKPNTGQNGTPDSGKKRREPAEIVTGVKQLRKTLDSLGLRDVLIGSPAIVEWHPRTWLTYGDRYDFSDGDTAAYINALTADAGAMDAIDAIDLQSYGTGVGNWAAGIASSHGKEVWVSLSATDAPAEWEATGANGKNAPINGPIVAGTCLSDLNHGVSRWNFWILYNLIRSASSTAPQYFVRYHYLAAISQRFDQGAVFRQCTGQHPRLPTPDMRWNYNRASVTQVAQTQPDIITAAAQNPDGTWALGIVNLSSLITQHKASNDSGVARTYRVTVNVPELKNIDSLRFTAGKCDDITGVKNGGSFLMRDGSLTVTINTRELYVLKSDRAITLARVRAGARTPPGLKIRETAVRGVFGLELTGEKPAALAVRVMTVDGRTVFRGDLSSGKAPVIDLRGAAPGMYLVSVGTGMRVAREHIFVR